MITVLASITDEKIVASLLMPVMRINELFIRRIELF